MAAGNNYGWVGSIEVQSSPDLDRILELPRRVPPSGITLDALVELMMRRYGRVRTTPCKCAVIDPNRKGCISRLRAVQAWLLYEIGLCRGAIGAVGVGYGKTTVGILAPLAAKSKLSLLLLPPTLIDQLVLEYQLVSQHFIVPSLIVHSRRRNSSIIQPGMQSVLHVLPYSQLSRVDATVFLETLGPDMIIADEAHSLRHAESVRTSRFMRYFASRPDTRFCGWSGSITDSSINDYAHLSAFALRERSPLPLHPEVVKEWALAIDPSDTPAKPGELKRLCEPGEELHGAFHRRLVETLGVVATTEPSIPCKLEITEKQAPDVPHAIQDALRDLRATWCRPDGEELVDALSVSRCARELACGFYYRWIFPRGESTALILEWLEARKQWHRELREKLKSRQPYLDSPLLCSLAAIRAWGVEPSPDDMETTDDEEKAKLLESWEKVPKWKAVCWPRWDAIKKQVKPSTEAVRVDDYLVQDACEWARSNLGVVWYSSSAFGRWLSEVSKLPLHGGGPKAGARIRAERGNRSIIASIQSHGTGRDGLQRLFADQLIVQPPTSSAKAEQLLGRLHRIGQKSQIVRAWYYAHTDELRASVDTSIARARYVMATIGSSQKILAGTSDDPLSYI